LGIVGAEDRYLQWRFDHEKQIEDFVGDLGQYERPRVFLETSFKGLNDVGTLEKEQKETSC
jgi:hypothetical protein